MPIGFIVKLIAGAIFIFIYSNYYGGGELTADAGKFLKEGAILAHVFYEAPLDYFKFLFNLETSEMVRSYLDATTHWAGDPNAVLNDSKNLVKIHSLFHLISFGYYPIHLILSCFISLFGVYHLTKAFKLFTAFNEKWLFSLILLVPSALFWTSGLLKEPFLFLGIGLFCRGLISENQLLKRSLFLAFGLFLLLSFKPYSLVCILLAWVAYFLFVKIQRKLIAFGIVLTFIASFILYHLTVEHSRFTTFISHKQSDFIGISKGGTYIRNDSCFFIFNDAQMDLLEIREGNYFLKEKTPVEYIFPYTKNSPKKTIAYPNSEPWEFGYKYQKCGSYIPVDYIDNSSTQLIKNIPQALKNSTLRPYYNDPGSDFKFLSFLEIWLLFGALIYSIFNRRTINKREFAIIMALATFSIALLLLIGWTTPVLGAIVRYRFSAFLAISLIGIILLKNKKNVIS